MSFIIVTILNLPDRLGDLSNIDSGGIGELLEVVHHVLELIGEILRASDLFIESLDLLLLGLLHKRLGGLHFLVEHNFIVV